MPSRSYAPVAVQNLAAPFSPLSYAHWLQGVMHRKVHNSAFSSDTLCTELTLDNFLVTVLFSNRKECKMFREAETIILNECLVHGVSVDLVCSQLRTRNVVRVRRIIVARLRQETNLSWTEIGMALGRTTKSFRGAQRPLPRP